MIYFSVCSRKEKEPNSLTKLIDWCNHQEYTRINIAYDSSSIYEGHKSNIEHFKSIGLLNTDIIVLCHDDVDIISSPEKTKEYLNIAKKPGVGFVGVAGACSYDIDGAWWNARTKGAARGFVFQGSDPTTMTPNYFGRSGQVTVLDGCFIAATYETLQKVGLEQPTYLDTGWDFYDIHLTMKAHLDGLSNYVVPIIIMHESSGHMRQGWFSAKENFMRYHGRNIPCRIPTEKTHGLPS